VATGRAYDRTLLAIRRDDIEGFARHAAELRRAGDEASAKRLADAALETAVNYDMRALSAPPAVAKQQREVASRYYRATQTIMPHYDSESATNLNSLGYFLAERGSSSQDFVEAERLTRRSLQLLDKELAALPKNDSQSTSRLQTENMQANVRDSLAWALFRQGKLEEARREQERAVADAQRTLKQLGREDQMPPELHFHLGEIYRKLKLYTRARRQYDIALKLKPDDADTRAALKELPSDTITPAVP
jgi:tetratricopeptide (TPR) repeat protein